jgi:predicted nucleotidyltransferase
MDDQGYGPSMTLQRPPRARLPLPLEAIETFCRKWRIEELALFGSVLREDFPAASDVYTA